MQMLAHSPPKFRWKLYFGLVAILTVVGLPTTQHTAMGISHTILALLSLAGLFAYAWSTTVPGPSVFWRSVAVASVVLTLADGIVNLGTPAGQRLLHNPLAIAIAFLVIAFLTLPQAVALFRYAAWIARPEPKTPLNRAAAR